MTSATGTDPCFCTVVRQAARRLSQAYDAALAPAQISVNQYAVLIRIERLGPRTIQDLAVDLVMDRSTLGHLLRPLAARGLVVLARAPDDGRRRVLTLTPAGTAMLIAARPLWAEAQRRFLSSYGREAANHLHDLLTELAALPLGGTGPDRPPSPPTPP